jgi:ribosome-binding protein aMBF1 (putative translation factor)
MRLLAFHQRRLVVKRGRYTRRWQLRSDKHLNPTCLADHVRAKRLKENLTMKELAEKLGVSKGTLKYWEMHKNPPSEDNRKMLVEYLGFDPGSQRAETLTLGIQKSHALAILL